MRYFVCTMDKGNLIEVIRYVPGHKKEWDLFVDRCKNGTFLFKRDFIEYHGDRFDDFSLLFYFNGELTALFPACVQDASCYSHKGLTYGGLLVGSECRFSLFRQLFGELLGFLKRGGYTELIVKPVPSLYCEAANDELFFLHQFYGGKSGHTIGSVVYNLKKPVVSKSVKRNASRAVREGIVIRQTNDFKMFWNELLVPRLNDRFHKKPVHSLDEMLWLKEKFPDEIQLTGAFLKDEMVAGTVLFRHKNYIKSQYIAGRKDYDKLGGLDLLHMKVIQDSGKDYFDFGTSGLENSPDENSGLLEWKEQFGARTLVFSTYNFKIS